MDERRRNIPVTAEEWEEILTGIPEWAKGEPDAEEYAAGGTPEERAELAMTNWAQEDCTLKVVAAAAFALGLFSWEDVQRHREYERNLTAGLELRSLLDDPQFNEGTERVRDMRDWHRSMADRIEALLPPTEDHAPDQ